MNTSTERSTRQSLWHRPTGRLCWDLKGVSVVGTQLFKKGEHIFERYTDPSVIVTAI